MNNIDSGGDDHDGDDDEDEDEKYRQQLITKNKARMQHNQY